MRGIPTKCLKYHAEPNHISVLDVYNELYTNNVIIIGLTNDGNDIVCKHNTDYVSSNVSDFGRTCKYIRYEKDSLFIN